MMTPRRTRARKYISLRERLAAAYSMLLPQDQRDELRAAMVPAKHVLALFTDDHGILHALRGSDRWWNLTPRLRGPDLKAKDARDTSIVAKVRRLAREHEEFRRKLLTRAPGQKRERSGRWPQGRKLQSRGFQRRERP